LVDSIETLSEGCQKFADDNNKLKHPVNKEMEIGLGEGSDCIGVGESTHLEVAFVVKMTSVVARTVASLLDIIVQMKQVLLDSLFPCQLPEKAPKVLHLSFAHHLQKGYYQT